MITVYVLQGKTGLKYVGITKDLPRRIQEHRLKKTKAGQLLREFSILHTEEYPDYLSAREREIYLKSGKGREWLNQLKADLNGQS